MQMRAYPSFFFSQHWSDQVRVTDTQPHEEHIRKNEDALCVPASRLVTDFLSVTACLL